MNSFMARQLFAIINNLATKKDSDGKTFLKNPSQKDLYLAYQEETGNSFTTFKNYFLASLSATGLFFKISWRGDLNFSKTNFYEYHKKYLESAKDFPELLKLIKQLEKEGQI